MNYLQLVREAMIRAGTRQELPTTLVGALDIALDFRTWVADSWRELQEESTGWWFRQKLDQTVPLAASADSIAMPTGLETINYRTASIYTTPKVDENNLRYVRYENWRMGRDTISTQEGRPTLITERPDEVIQVWPVADQNYTIRFDGVWDIDEMSDDTDTPGSNVSGGTLLPERYHYVLVWDAVRRYAEHHEDPEGIEKAQSKYKAQHARLAEKKRPPVYIKRGRLLGARGYRNSYRDIW